MKSYMCMTIDEKTFIKRIMFILYKFKLITKDDAWTAITKDKYITENFLETIQLLALIEYSDKRIIWL